MKFIHNPETNQLEFKWSWQRPLVKVTHSSNGQNRFKIVRSRQKKLLYSFSIM